ncbi:MAG TPA: hypothetical protein VJN72_06310 [Gaiellales bacterium]|nr:hypothetical protein [Gaiellales bacterium]
MNRLDLARRALTAALEEVLPGRVFAYPPTDGRAVAPSIWIEQPNVARVSMGTNSRGIQATLPVWIVYDGAVHAQIAGLDDLVSQVWDTVERLAHNTPDIATAQEYRRGDGTTWRATVIRVDVNVAAVTLCLPDVEPAVVPPVPIREEAPVG